MPSVQTYTYKRALETGVKAVWPYASGGQHCILLTVNRLTDQPMILTMVRNDRTQQPKVIITNLTSHSILSQTLKNCKVVPELGAPYLMVG